MCLRPLTAVAALLALSAARPAPAEPAKDAGRVDACAVALAPQAGDADIDRVIARRAARAAASADGAQLERLGWAFVRKARISNDPGFFTLAHHAALCILRDEPRSLGAKLLAAHALHSLHRFGTATELARALVAARNRWLDHALLGDLLMEQGDLDGALAAYQHAMDLRPGPQMYSRAAHMRWLKGDLPGALAMMRAAAKGTSARDAEGAAWIYSRLALYELQRRHFETALEWADAALALQPDSAAALQARGRIELARGRAAAAVLSLEPACARNRLPDCLWSLAEALRADRREQAARRVEDDLLATGASNDPRTFALYLATHGRQSDHAVRLARTELEARRDVFTWDALAWAQLAAGDAQAAYASMRHAVAEGTDDARLFLHAAAITAAAGKREEAVDWRRRAAGRQHMLLPSERRRLRQLDAEIARNPESTAKEGTS
jgi:tetratricopeptide (TPR) repeat protein